MMRVLGRIALMLAALVAAMWVFGPYEDATLTPSATAMQVDTDLDAHFARIEAPFDDITPGTQKRVIWADAPGARTDWAVLYVHGFSATSEEIRPVPDRLAAALGANLIYTRLQGHGRGGDAMATASVRGWVDDLAEGLAAARIAGERVVILSTSTGGTLVAATAQNADMMQNVAGMIFVSPNFGINNPLAPLLGWPAARYWLPTLAGERRSFAPLNAAHGTYWTTEYPSVAALPMAALIKAATAQDHSAQTHPALFWFAREDSVVRPDITARIAADWGGDTTIVTPVMGPGDDPNAHVIAGDILSPGQTDATAQGMIDWVRTLEGN